MDMDADDMEYVSPTIRGISDDDQIEDEDDASAESNEENGVDEVNDPYQ